MSTLRVLVNRSLCSAAVFASWILASCHSNTSVSTLQMGTGVDNGGDTITCVHDAELQASGDPYYEGIFTLDYFLTVDPRVGTSDDLEGQSWEQFHGQVSSFISNKLPSLASSFEQYASLLENGNDAEFRVWKASDLSLSDLPDEGLVQQVPRNCLVVRDGQTTANLQQMVRRRYVAGASAQKIFYYYDFARFGSLKNNLPLQFSYLAVHEWLWDFVDFPWVNRAINHLIHSKAGQNLSQGQFLDYLRSLGVQINADGFIGTSGSQEQPVRNSFQEAPLCRYERRMAAEFLTASQHVVLQPGETKNLTLKVPLQSDNVGQVICGTALLFSHQVIGGTGSGSLDLRIGRGVSSFQTSVSVGSSLTQSSYTGVCTDILCAQRSGPLRRLVFPGNFLGSQWQLSLTNSSSHALVEVRMPFLLFVDMHE